MPGNGGDDPETEVDPSSEDADGEENVLPPGGGGDDPAANAICL